MWVYLLIALTILFIVGNALVLLRTAKKPKVPEGFKTHADDDQDSGW